MTFLGTLEELQALVGQLELRCHWVQKGAYHLCEFDDERSNLKLNWWPESGELRLVGDPEIRPLIQERLIALLSR